MQRFCRILLVVIRGRNTVASVFVVLPPGMQETVGVTLSSRVSPRGVDVNIVVGHGAIVI